MRRPSTTNFPSGRLRLLIDIGLQLQSSCCPASTAHNASKLVVVGLSELHSHAPLCSMAHSAPELVVADLNSTKLRAKCARCADLENCEYPWSGNLFSVDRNLLVEESAFITGVRRFLPEEYRCNSSFPFRCAGRPSSRSTRSVSYFRLYDLISDCFFPSCDPVSVPYFRWSDYISLSDSRSCSRPSSVSPTARHSGT